MRIVEKRKMLNMALGVALLRGGVACGVGRRRIRNEAFNMASQARIDWLNTASWR